MNIYRKTNYYQKNKMEVEESARDERDERSACER